MIEVLLQIAAVIVMVITLLIVWGMNLSTRMIGNRLMSGACTVPPRGWKCSRTPGHTGPCAATSACGTPIPYRL